MPLDQETVTQQLTLLATYRRTLAHLVAQAAQYGGEVFAPPQTANGIAEARVSIAHIKAYLRENGTSVKDGADELTEAERKIAEQLAAEQRALDAVLETYISQMEDLISNENLLKSGVSTWALGTAEALTLEALHRLDGEHNQKLIQFLQDEGLLHGKYGLIGTHTYRRADLFGADLRGANLKGAYLFGVILRRANLEGANLEGANLECANLQYANLKGANLKGATMPDGSIHE